MVIKKYKLGELIEHCNIRNSGLQYKIADVKGISIQKQFIETKADMTGVSLRPYFVVSPDSFAYVTITSRNSEKLTIAHNDTNSTYIVSSSYVVFQVKSRKILSDYLYMYYNRPEFDRYVRFNSWGSAREAFSWNEMQNIEIALPPLSVQRKYVAIYQALLANQRAYEQGLEDLDIAIVGSIEKFKHSSPRIAVGEVLEQVDERNRDGKITNVQGININKEFIPSVANLSNTDLTKYKVIRKNQFAANFMHVMRDGKIPFGLYCNNEPCIISPAYPVFEVKNDKILPEFLMLWLNRSETDRFAWFIADSSIRGGLEIERFYEIKIPLPTKTQQQAIVDSYHARRLIQQNTVTLGNVINDICPILTKGSLEEAAQR